MRMDNNDIVPPLMSVATVNTQTAGEVPLNRNQIRGFWAAWGGWALDGMDSFIYALVLVPSLRDLLPRSGISPNKGEIGFYGGLLFALFLVGWGLAFLWGPVGDKFGRVRALMITIIWYSVFTFLSALVTNVWQLAVLRLLAGIGIGGEWAMGGTFVAEEWPESRRRAGAGYMHTGYYFGIFSRRSSTTGLAAASGTMVGASCLSSAVCPRCCLLRFVTVSQSPRAGKRKNVSCIRGPSGSHLPRYFHRHCGGGPFSTHYLCWLPSVDCGRAQCMCLRR